MSRDTNFGGSYLVLMKAAIIARCFWGMKAGSDWDSCLPWQRSLAPHELGRGEGYRLDQPPAASTHPSQDPLVPDADGDLLAIKVFEQGNCVFARHPKEIFELDRRDFAMIA